jgi:hypothetical protein
MFRSSSNLATYESLYLRPGALVEATIEYRNSFTSKIAIITGKVRL